MTGVVGIFAVGLAALGAAGWWFNVAEKRSRAMLEDWAAENNLALLSVQIRPFVKGPYWFSSKAQMVYRIAVRDDQGVEREGWARCGSPLGGPLVHRVDAKWDLPGPSDPNAPRAAGQP